MTSINGESVKYCGEDLVDFYDKEVGHLPKFGGVGDFDDFLTVDVDNLIGVLGL